MMEMGDFNALFEMPLNYEIEQNPFKDNRILLYLNFLAKMYCIQWNDMAYNMTYYTKKPFCSYDLIYYDVSLTAVYPFADSNNYTNPLPQQIP